MHGRGIFDLSGNLVYEGLVENGQPHGSGKMIVKNSDGSILCTTEGDFSYGKLSGWGVYEGPTSKYEGEFLENLLHGKGTLTY